MSAAADQALAQLWPGLLDANAVRDPIDLLARTAGALEQMAEVVGKRVNELNGKVAAGEHLTQFRAEVVLLDRVLDKLLRAGDVMARLGLAERQVELQQEQAQLVTSAFMAALQVVSSLLPADRDLMVRTFLAGLGRGPETLELEGAAS